MSRRNKEKKNIKKIIDLLKDSEEESKNKNIKKEKKDKN